MNKSKLEFGGDFVCPYCFTRIELDELEMLKIESKEIKNNIIESLHKIEQTIEKMKGNDSLQQYYEEIKQNIDNINEDAFMDYMVCAPDIYWCEECHNIIMWQDKEIVYPDIGRLLPNNDIPDDIKKIYMEALVFSEDSCATSAQNLRKVLEHLLPYIDGDIKKYNTLEMKINHFQKGNIDEITKKSLHLIRILGNKGSHELNTAEINFKVIYFLFETINEVAKRFITNKKQIEEINSILSKSAKQENREK